VLLTGPGLILAGRLAAQTFTTLHSFSEINNSTNNDGANSQPSLILSNNTLYGDGSGWRHYWQMVRCSDPFVAVSPPKLTIIPSGSNVILRWPTNYAGFTLQSATNLVSSVWTTDSSAPVVVNGQNTVTNPISGTQQF